MKNVTWDKRLEKYKAYITTNNRTGYIGHFKTEEEAAYAVAIVKRLMRRRLVNSVQT